MTILGVISLVVSIGSALMAVYFWLVESRNKLPRVVAHAIERPVVEVVGRQDAPVRYLGAKVQLVVVNLSELPNVLLGVRLTARARDGNWVGAREPKEDANRVTQFKGLPINLLPRVLNRVWAWVWLEVPAKLIEDAEQTKEYYAALDAALGGPLEVRVEMKMVRGGTFHVVVRPPREGAIT